MWKKVDIARFLFKKEHLYIALAGCLAGLVLFFSTLAGIFLSLLLLTIYFYWRHKMHLKGQFASYMKGVGRTLDYATLCALQNVPVAIAIVNKDGILHWGNTLLFDWSNSDDLEIGKSILNVWKEVPFLELWKASGKKLCYLQKRCFLVECSPLVEGVPTGQQLAVFYFSEVTELENFRRKSESDKPVVMIIQIDNYNDVLQGMQDLQRANLISEIGKILNNYFLAEKAFIRKYNGDSYVVFANKSNLMKMIENKFAILDVIREISLGNKIAPTLSMGVAVDEENIVALAQRAQTGLELSLGRGGDQVAVYIGGKVRFYGGKAKPVEKSTRVRARIMAQAVMKIISESDDVIIMGHRSEDFDSLGAALGLMRMVKEQKKPVFMVVSEPNIAVSKLSDLLYEYEEYQDFIMSAYDAIHMVSDNTSLIIVDTHRKSLVAVPEIMKHIERVVVIDHHRRAEDCISDTLLSYLEPSASSTCEMVVEMLQYLSCVEKLTRMEASVLFAGIILDTKNFTVQTGVRTFEAAALLRSAGADPGIVRRLLMTDMDTFKLRAQIASTIEMIADGIALAICPKEIRQSSVLAAQVADSLLNVETIVASFVLYVIDDKGSVGICARSNGELNVHLLMEKFAGGGHRTVAGAQIENVPIYVIRKQIIEYIKEYLEEDAENESDFAGRSEKSG